MTENSQEIPAKFFEQVHNVAHEIFDEIVAPICSVEGMGMDIYRAALSDFDNADPKNRKMILAEIAKKYGIEQNRLESIQKHPLALIALCILDQQYNQI